MRRSATQALLVACSLVPSWSCVDGTPVDLPAGEVAISASPVFAIAPTPEELAQIDLLRVTLHGIGSAPTVLEQRIDASSQAEWTFNLQVEVRPGRPLSLVLETELIDVDGATQSVEWSGRTRAFDVRASFEPQELRQVNLYRGPLANLGLTAVDFGAGALRILEGTTSTLHWTLAGDTAGTTMYLRALDPDVASLEPEAMVRGQRPGATKVVVYGGMVADTVDLTVGALATVALPSLAELEATVMPQLDYVTSDLFMNTFGDATGASSLRSEMTSLGSALRGRRGPDVVTSFEGAKSVWRSYGRGTRFKTEDGPQLGVIELSLILVANTLQTGLP